MQELWIRVTGMVDGIWGFQQQRECSEVVHKKEGWWEGIDQYE